MEFLLVVLGAIVGAVATGGVGIYEARRGRRERRRVAARVVMGDLNVLDEGLAIVLERDSWPDRLDLPAIVETWREVRKDFAPGVKAWEWALVDGTFSNLHRLSLMVRLGESLSPNDRDVVESFVERIPRTLDIVYRHGMTMPERHEVVRMLGRGSEARDPE
jgi:hypothetical protein